MIFVLFVGGGTRLLSVPSSSLSSVSIQKAFVTTVTTAQQQQGSKTPSLTQPNVVSLPYGATSITVPKPNVSVSAVPVARVVPQSYVTPNATTSVTHSSAVSAAAAAYLSRPGQTPIAVSELSLTSVPSGSSGRVALASAPSVRITGGQDAIARLIPSSPSKPGILRRRGDIDRNQLVLSKLPFT